MFKFLKFRSLKIRQKIIGSFLLIILVFNIHGIFSIFSITQSDKLIVTSSEIINPSLNELQNFTLLVTQSKMFITNWVYQPRTATEDKDSLRKLHATFPEFKDRLTKLKNQWQSQKQAKALDSIFRSFEGIIKKQKKIMYEITDEEDYANENLMSDMKILLQNEIIKDCRIVLNKLSTLTEEKEVEIQTIRADLAESFNWLRFVTVGVGIILFFGGLLFALVISSNITKPIRYINDVFLKIGSGELPEDKHTRFNEDEVGEMAVAADLIVNSLRATSEFAENIGKGNYQASYMPLSDKDVLGNALLEMRNNLSKVAEEDRRRNWQNEGIALFGDLLRRNNNDLSRLSDVIVSNLVKYVKANQAGLFIVEEENDEEFMILSSCYAWDKKKYLDQKIHLGEGLAGQAWQEQATIYLTDVPQDYVMITSGLGEANPNSLLIVPLKVNDETYGVVELASFNEFLKYEIEFVEKIAESIASTIASVKTSQRTSKLLEESNLIAKQVQQQEELLKQRAEKLENSRQEIELTKRANREKDTLLNALNLIMETDDNFLVKTTNKLAEFTLKYERKQLRGMTLEYLADSYTQLEDAKEILSTGEIWDDVIFLKDKNYTRLRFKINGKAVFNKEGEIEKFIFVLNQLAQEDSDK